MTTDQNNTTRLTMRRNIEWLRCMEQCAASLYSEAAQIFSDDDELQDLLLCLKADEEDHARLMNLALFAYEAEPSMGMPFEIDDSMKKKHENIAQRVLDMIDDGTLTGYAMLASAIELEHAELNSLFTYVIESLKGKSDEFIDYAAEIEKHKKSIERFVRTHPEYKELTKIIPKLPKVWDEKILVLDRSEPFIKFMDAVLSKEGSVEGTGDGRDALKRITEGHFSLIISDIELNGIDGLTLYKDAIKEDPTIKDRILFLTSNDDKEYLRFFKAEKLPYLVKPAPVKDIVEHSISILEKRRVTP